MPYVNVFIHFVWSTKNRHPFLETVDLRRVVWQHIAENARRKEILVDIVGGYSDHCHCLLALGTNQNISTIIQLLKGESSYWINKNSLCRQKFAWQEHYYGTAVSENDLPQVRNYIKDQESHHQL